METKYKLATLELFSGLFGWAWLIASFAALYFFVSAIFFEGSWNSFFWAIGIGVIGKWISGGLKDNQTRVAFEAQMVEAGMSKEEAGREWLKRYNQE